MKRDLTFNVLEIQEAGGLSFEKKFSARDFIAEETESDAWERTFGAGCSSGECALKLDFSVGGSNILVDGRVGGRWELPCSRCLAPHDVTFETAIDETYPLTSGLIDLWETVREALILSIPAKSLCNPECKGLCPQCGKNLNEGQCGCKPAPRTSLNKT